MLPDIGWVLAAELLALGAVVGFLAGLLGIGGGMMMVPVMTLLLSQRGVEPGHAVKMAIATSMATILFTSLSSVREHHRLGAVRWELAATLAPGIVLGGLAAGAGAFALLKGQGLALFFAVFIGWTALRLGQRGLAGLHQAVLGVRRARAQRGQADAGHGHHGQRRQVEVAHGAG